MFYLNFIDFCKYMLIRFKQVETWSNKKLWKLLNAE